jgi:hypothetical protein
VSAQENFFNNVEISEDDSAFSDSPFSIIGWVTQKVAYGLEDPGPMFSRESKDMSKVETSLFTQIDWRPNANLNFRFSGNAYHDEIYRIDDSRSYTRDEKNEFRNRFEVRDFYVETQLSDDLYLKVGNQILAWGFSEFLRVTDIVNTEDQYTFGQHDLEDLRLQVPASLLSYSINDWVFDGVVTYRAGHNYMAPEGDEFDQFIQYRQSNQLIDKRRADNPWEFFFRASTHFDSGDIQIVAGDYNNNQLTLDGINRPLSLSPILEFSQQRMQTVGIAANHTRGSWLVFGEMGMNFNTPVMPGFDSNLRLVNGWDEKDQLLGVLGVEYNGFSNTTISFETDSIQVQDYQDGLLAERNQLSVGTRVYWTGWNDRLQMLSAFNKLSDSQGYVSRVSLDYDWNDNIDFGLLWVDYSAKQDSIFHNFRNNDMLQFSVKYSFQH